LDPGSSVPASGSKCGAAAPEENGWRSAGPGRSVLENLCALWWYIVVGNESTIETSRTADPAVILRSADNSLGIAVNFGELRPIWPCSRFVRYADALAGFGPCCQPSHLDDGSKPEATPALPKPRFHHVAKVCFKINNTKCDEFLRASHPVGLAISIKRRVGFRLGHEALACGSSILRRA
jgi:hypothetical protein